jgi:Tol biopolymer transport system component
VWVDRQGREQPVPVAVRGFENPRIAPDGERIAVTIREGDSDVWVIDIGRGTLTRITHEDGEDHSAVWTPDGRHVTYSSTRADRSRVRQKAADGSGSEEELFVTDSHRHLGGWADGRTLLTDTATPNGSDLRTVTVGEKGSDTVYLETTFSEQHPWLSPDARWVAYTSNQSGRSEVYVQAFPGSSGRSQVSTDGGTEPVWARSGRELFYRVGDRMMAVAVESRSTFKAAAPRVLFTGRYASVAWGEANYDVSPDGRFLMLRSEAELQRAGR